MRVSPGDGDAIGFRGQQIGSPGTAADEGSARSRQCAVDALGTAQAKLDDGFALGGEANARGFSSNERLEIDKVEKGSFQDLSLEDGALNAQQRFVGENDGAFGDGIQVASEPKSFEITQKALIEHRFSVVTANVGEVVKFTFFELKLLQKFDHLSEAAGDGEAALERRGPKR